MTVQQQILQCPGKYLFLHKIYNKMQSNYAWIIQFQIYLVMKNL